MLAFNIVIFTPKIAYTPPLANKAILNYHKTVLKKYRKINSMIRNLVKYLPMNNNWKISEDLKKTDRIKKKLQEINPFYKNINNEYNKLNEKVLEGDGAKLNIIGSVTSPCCSLVENIYVSAILRTASSDAS